MLNNIIISTVGFNSDEEREQVRAGIAESLSTMMAMPAEEDNEMDTVTVWEESTSEPYFELDSEHFVSWECFDELPYLVSLDGIRVNLIHRPAFFPDEEMYRAVADGDEDSYMVEWIGSAGQCDWDNPFRIITLDEYNAENAGNAKDHAATFPAEPDRTQHAAVPGAVKTDLLGNRTSGTVPSRQLTLFDKTEFTRTFPAFPAVILREGGEQAFGKIDSRTPKKELTFTAHATGNKFRIPLRYCNISWAGNAAIIDIAERDLERNCSWYGMFASCRLF